MKLTPKLKLKLRRMMEHAIVLDNKVEEHKTLLEEAQRELDEIKDDIEDIEGHLRDDDATSTEEYQRWMEYIESDANLSAFNDSTEWTWR